MLTAAVQDICGIPNDGTTQLAVLAAVSLYALQLAHRVWIDTRGAKTFSRDIAERVSSLEGRLNGELRGIHGELEELKALVKMLVSRAMTRDDQPGPPRRS
jgi:hypothetical protein